MGHGAPVAGGRPACVVVVVVGVVVVVVVVGVVVVVVVGVVVVVVVVGVVVVVVVGVVVVVVVVGVVVSVVGGGRPALVLLGSGRTDRALDGRVTTPVLTGDAPAEASRESGRGEFTALVTALDVSTDMAPPSALVNVYARPPVANATADATAATITRGLRYHRTGRSVSNNSCRLASSRS